MKAAAAPASSTSEQHTGRWWSGYSAGGELDFRFEMSPHTLRVHAYLNGKPLGLSLRSNTEVKELARMVGESAGSQLQREAGEFRRAWNLLSPYQQKLARGVAHKARVHDEFFCVRKLHSLQVLMLALGAV